MIAKPTYKELEQKVRSLEEETLGHKRTEASLHESEIRYRSLIENAHDMIQSVKPDGSFDFVNRSWLDTLGYTRADLAFLNLFNIIHPDSLQHCQEAFSKIMNGRRVRNIQATFVTKDGRSVSVEGGVTPRFIEGKIVATHGIFRDISERKQAAEEKATLEAQLQQARKMEAIGTLAGGIAHDFNNLLMAIQSRTAIMLMNKGSSHPDFDHLRGIDDHIANAADLTRQLLGFARGGKYEVKSTDLNELLKKQNRLFGRTKKEITLRGKYEKFLWSVDVDRGQIEQVLLNLYVNAWQAMPGGGNLYLETENVILNENHVKPFSIEPGRYVKISITDAGIGMDKATQKKIFDPFFTTKEPGRGSGLGLASAYGIIKNHGGLINVFSEKGEGTTFNVYLPSSEKEVVIEKISADHTLNGFETVLFVDDEKMITEVAEDLFKLIGYKVLIAESGKEAIAIYEENKEQIDMVILDMIMPDMNGGEVYDRLKDINPNVKVLLSSGYSAGERAKEILDRGCNGFIQKPFKIKALSLKLREILDSK
jgi:two-component system, cell cycle sensor histidine kinase and response regulator CckA